jgi:hypothetical protein
VPAEFRRKLYKRGSSHETTIPKPMLFEHDSSEPLDVAFKYDPKAKRWYVEIERRADKALGDKRSKEKTSRPKKPVTQKNPLGVRQ